MNTATRTSPRPVDRDQQPGILVIRRILPADPQTVFHAWTEPEWLTRWFCPGELVVAEAELDLRVGGRYRVVMQNPQGETHSPSGVYEEIVPNEKLVFSWQWQGDELVTRVAVELRPVANGQTELTLTHTGFPDEQVRSAHEKGWSGCFVKLEALLPRAKSTPSRGSGA